jgi:hypothetical protein
MIANTDWSLSNMHNIVLFADKTDAAPVPLIYDFDWSGIIAAPYAKPAPQLGIENVDTRLYRGYCISESYLQNSRKKFMELKPQFEQLIAEFEFLEERRKEQVWKYIENFYEILENDKRFQNEVILKCRNYRN